MTIRVGLIGYGLGGRCFHAPFVGPAGMALVAVASSRRAEIGAAYPAADVVADPAVLIARRDIDLVAISTPTDSHADLVRAALDAGKHVVVDKPFAATSFEAAGLIERAAARGRILTVLQNRRWDADFLTLERLVAEGALGELRWLQLRFDRFRPVTKQGWRNEERPGAGVPFDLGAHLVDQAMRLAGRPDWVFADLTRQGEGAVADDGFSILLAAGPARILVAATPFAAAPGPRIVAHGTRGSFVKSGLDIQEEQLQAGRKPDEPGFGIEPAASHGTLTDAAGSRIVASEPGCYLAFWRRLAAAIEAGGPPPVDAADSLAGLRVLEAARESHQTGRRIALG